MTRVWPSLLGAVQVVHPETVLRWHRAGFKVLWRWKSRHRAGRPRIDRGLRDLIRRMSRENRLWGASRIHGELLMLGFEVAQLTVSKYLVRPSKPPSQTWKTFLRNHAEAIAAIDVCVVRCHPASATSSLNHKATPWMEASTWLGVPFSSWICDCVLAKQQALSLNTPETPFRSGWRTRCACAKVCGS